MRPGRGFGFLLAGAAGFVAGQAALRDAVYHLDHFSFVGLARDLEQQRLRQDAALDAGFADLIGDHVQRHGFGDAGACAADFLGDVVVGVIEMIG